MSKGSSTPEHSARYGRNGKTRKRSKTSSIPLVSTLYKPVGKSIRLMKNVAGTGANIALTIPSKVLKSARKNTRKIARRAAKNTRHATRDFMKSLGSGLKKTIKYLTT